MEHVAAANFPYKDGWYLTGIVAPSSNRRGRATKDKKAIGPIALCFRAMPDGTVTTIGRYIMYSDNSIAIKVGCAADGEVISDLLEDLKKSV